MIHLFVGDNSYARDVAVRELLGEREAEHIDGDTLDEFTLSDIVRGTSLFATERVVLLRDLSRQRELWDKLVAWADDLVEQTTLILVEQSVDRRTKTYKHLQKIANITATDAWTDRDARTAEQWLSAHAAQRGMTLSRQQVSDMVQRATVADTLSYRMVIDQALLVQAIDALSSESAITDEMIATVLPPVPSETVFQLLDHAVAQDAARVGAMLGDIHRDQDPYMVFATLAKQWSQLVMVKLAAGDTSSLGIHPYMLSKLVRQAGMVSQHDAAAIIHTAADLDAKLKLSEASPWEAVDRLIMAITLR